MQKYRLEIDGLRGISVILVVLYHAKVNFFSGGFFGVDIFFVISGFLITNIIINLIQKNQFSLIKFYERRIRRIIPALYILLLFLVIYSYLIQGPYFSRDLSQSIFFTPIFLQNILNIFEGANYFNLSYDLKPLGHTWSLSIEEQFYLIFPLVIFIFFKSSKQFLYNLILFLFLSSLFLYFYLGLSERYVGYHFFFTLSRVWEILFGCILAFKKFNFKKKSFLPLIGLTIIVLSVIIQNYISLALILRVFVVVGTGIIIISSFQNQENLINKILKSKILVFFGLISYSLYLWHMPIFSIYRDFFSFKTNIIENIYLIFITSVVNYLIIPIIIN